MIETEWEGESQEEDGPPNKPKDWEFRNAKLNLVITRGQALALVEFLYNKWIPVARKEEVLAFLRHVEEALVDAK